MQTRRRTVLASDLDGTLLPLASDQANHRDELDHLISHVEEGSMELIPVTGRDRAATLEVLEKHGISQFRFALCDLGISLLVRDAGGELREHHDYSAHLDQSFPNFRRDDLEYLLGDFSELSLRPPQKQNRFKVSYFADIDRLESIAEEMRRRLGEACNVARVVCSRSIVWNAGLVDVIPNGFSKAFALEWCIEHANVDREQVIFAGDGGNDFDAMTAGFKTIVVGNADAQLQQRVHAAHQSAGTLDRLFLASERGTSGVVAGCRWFGAIRSDTVASVDEMPVGATPVTRESTFFRVWAPKAKRLTVEHITESDCHRHTLQAGTDGYHNGLVQGISAGDRYQYSLDDRFSRPDPASRFQPRGVHDASMVVDHRRYRWNDAEYRGVQRRDLVIYELHIGTFTREGTYRAAIDRIDELVELGVTAIELMPLAQCGGSRNWGYDGVDLFAPHHAYGHPDDLKAFVDACHAVGVAVLLDVVYNHLGPEGNYLNDFAPYFSSRHRTPWGDAFNYDGRDCQHARQFVIDNVLYWLDAYHLDGLRLDAVHFMFDDSDPPILASIREAVDQFAADVSRPIHLIAEANIYDDCLIAPQEGSAYDAIWCDDIMHAIYSLTIPDINLAHREYCGASDLADALEHGFIYTGPEVTRIEHTDRSQLRGTQDRSYIHSLVCGIQTHDCVGNHPRGLRFHQLTSKSTQRAAAALLMLYPSIPILFMGEDVAADSPFMFFVDFHDARLRRAVDRGRKKEYPQHAWEGAIAPSHTDAFEKSKCTEISDPAMRQWYRDVLRLRRQWLDDRIIDAANLRVSCDLEHSLFGYQYEAADGQPRFVLSRLSPGGAATGSITIQVDGSVDLTSETIPDPANEMNQAGAMNQAGDTEQSGLIQLGPNAAVIGRGHWRLA